MSETGHRTMAIAQLAGLSIKTLDGVLVTFVEPDEDSGDSDPAGVREPRKPKKPSPADMRRRRMDTAPVAR